MDNFSERLKYLRLNKNLTQKQLAIESNLTERGIQRYESGERTPTLSAAILLADALDISLDYLVGRSDDPTRH